MTASVELPAVVHTRQRRTPDFFIVGHPKCGTTALYEMLRRHPQVYMPDLKEPRFFADDMHSRDGLPKPGLLPETYDQYLSLFDPAGPEQRVGEASPFYLTSRTAASQIAEVRPDARIIAILREPASFLRSLHFQFVQSQVETMNNLCRAIALEDARRQGKGIPSFAHFKPQVLMYSDHVRYVQQLRRYNAVFPSEQMLVLIYDDLRSDNDATLRTVLRFLGVNDAVPIEMMEANPTVRVRSQPFDRLVRAVSIGHGPATRTAKAAIKALTPRQVRRRALYIALTSIVYGKPPPPDESIMFELRRRFKPEVVALSEYLDRDLVTLWGYDNLG